MAVKVDRQVLLPEGTSAMVFAIGSTSYALIESIGTGIIWKRSKSRPVSFENWNRPLFLDVPTLFELYDVEVVRFGLDRV